MYISTAIREAYTIEEVAELVNEGACEGLQGIEFTSGQLAGQYAFDACEDSGYCQEPDYDLTEKEVEAHLEMLEDAGAQFDFQKALEHAMALLAESESDEDED